MNHESEMGKRTWPGTCRHLCPQLPPPPPLSSPPLKCPLTYSRFGHGTALQYLVTLDIRGVHLRIVDAQTDCRGGWGVRLRKGCEHTVRAQFSAPPRPLLQSPRRMHSTCCPIMTSVSFSAALDAGWVQVTATSQPTTATSLYLVPLPQAPLPSIPTEQPPYST